VSSLYVRQKFEQWLQDAALSVPFYPTINEEQNPADDIWCTAQFTSGYRDVLTFCNGIVSEDGEVEVVYFGRPGVGYNSLLAAVEADVNLLAAMTDTSGKLVINGRSAPFEFSLGSARKDYSLSVFFDYSYFE
jgi:hypothetical protein